jgi:membrane-bound lytic murein transglycosylase D
MIIKYLVFATLMLCCITSSDPYFGTDLSWRKIPPAQKDDVTELAWMSTDSFKTYLMDEDNRVSNKFTVTKYYYPTVNFWFLVYTQFDSSNVVIHDKSNLSLIYKVLDFSSLHEKKLNKNILYVLQQKISNERINKIKNDLKDLSRDPFSLSHDAKSIYRTLKEAGIALPIKKLDRQAFFNKLKDNIRTQTGQRNFIKDGIIRSLPYKTFLNKYFAEHKLPPELLAVPFLESSFNPKAESRVGAMGTWQFMPLIASYYVPKKSLSPQYDYRSNVGVISVAAAYLMKENFQLMKSWDMAVTAYNSGTKHLLKTKRELASTKKDVNLEAVIKHSDSQHFGFASKNFYSEFLALVHALAYEEELFSDIHRDDRYNMEDDLDFYVTKCSMKLDKNLDTTQMDDVLYHNHQINQAKQPYPRGMIITSKEKLPGSKFFKLSLKHMMDFKPKDWSKLLKNQSCSTK